MDLGSKSLTEEKLSILIGCDRELTDPLSLSQIWDNLLSEKPSLLQDTALISILPSGEIKHSFTFQQLDQHATHLAQQLRNNFQRPDGDWIIAVCLPPSTEFIICLLAIFKSGAAYLPLDPNSTKDRVAFILKNANPPLVLTSTEILNEKYFDQIQENVKIFCIDSCLTTSSFDQPAMGFQQHSTMQQDLAVVLYTSGSTGVPKDARLTHSTIINRINWQWCTFPYTTGEVAIFKTALTFVDSIIEIWAPLLKGVPIVIVPKILIQNPQLFVDTLERFYITRLFLVPSLFSSILSSSYVAEKRKLRSLRYWFCTGEVLSGHLLIDFYQKLDGVVCNMYGSTEVTDVTCHIFRSKEDLDSSLFGGQVPLGSPLDNCAVYILNSAGELVQKGQIGEIYVSGPYITSGRYQKCEHLNNNIVNFVSNHTKIKKKGHQILYRTGDFGRIINDKLFYEGRADSQVKVRGHRVDLSEVNAVLDQLDQVEIGVVLCWKLGLPEQEIIAFVKSTMDYFTLHHILREKIMSYAMPRLVFIEEVPFLINGKIDRQRLLKDYENNYRIEKCALKWDEDELNLLEEKERMLATALLKTVSTVLGGSLHKSLSLIDDYFFVGGNSLNAVIVVTKLRDQGFSLELSDFLSAKSLQEMVSKMGKSEHVDKNYQEGHLDEKQQNKNYRIEALNGSHKEEVLRILCNGFAQKNELVVLAGSTCHDYEPFFSASWETVQSQSENLSFVVKDNQDRIIACSINHDALIKSVPLHSTTIGVKYVTELLEYVWELAWQQNNSLLGEYVDWKQGQVMKCRNIATDSKLLSAAENVIVVECIERENLLVAKRNGFQSVITLNSSPLTQQVCHDILGYEIVAEYQANEFIASDGTKPFAGALDSYLVTIGFKKL